MKNRNRLKKYLLLYLASIEAMTLSGCSNQNNQLITKKEYELEEDNIKNNDRNELSVNENNNKSTSINNKKSQSDNNKKSKINVDNMDKKVNKDNKTKKVISDKCNDINKKLNDIDSKEVKTKIVKEFIELVEFVSGNKDINGVYFNELDDKAKKDIKNMISKIDSKIEAKYPDYKEPVKEKYESIRNYIKENNLDDKAKKTKDKVVDKTSEFKEKTKNKTKDIIGEENYNKVGQKKDEIKDKTKDIAEEGKQKVKNWYSDLKKKYN